MSKSQQTTDVEKRIGSTRPETTAAPQPARAPGRLRHPASHVGQGARYHRQTERRI